MHDVKANCGYNGLYLNSSSNVNVSGLILNQPLDAAIVITDVGLDGVPGTNTSNIYIDGVSIKNSTSAIYVDLTNTSASNIVATNITVDRPSLYALRWRATAGTGGENYFDIQVIGVGSPAVNNVSSTDTSGLRYTISASESGRVLSSASHIISGTKFNETNGAAALKIWAPDSAAGQGNYNNALAFTGPAGSARTGAAIAGYQPTTDPAQCGLAFFTKSSTATNDTVAPRMWLDHSGNIILELNSSVTPAQNGQLMVQATSNTSLTFKYKGSDGTVRSASLTLS